MSEILPIFANGRGKNRAPPALLKSTVLFCSLQVLKGLVLEIRKQIPLLDRWGLDGTGECQNGSWEATETHHERDVKLTRIAGQDPVRLAER